MRLHLSFARLPISQRLGIGFALAGFLALFVALGVGLVNMAYFHQATASFNQALASAASLGQIEDDIERIYGDMANRLTFGASGDADSSFLPHINALINDVDQQIFTYYDLVGLDNRQLDTFVNDWGSYRSMVQVVAGDLQSGFPSQLAQARSLLEHQGQQEHITMQKDLQALVAFNQQQIESAHATASQSNAAAFWWAIGCAIAGFVVIMLLAWFIIRSILQQLNELLRLIRLVNQGSLNQRANIAGRNEVAVVAASMNDMLDMIVSLLNKEESLRTELERELAYLIEQVNPIGQGDLRLQVEVTNTLLGTLADVFNRVVEQLATLVARVRNSAQLTYTAAGTMVQQATELAQVGEHQATELSQANEGMEQLSTAAVNVARLARTSLSAATETVSSAQRGGQAALQVLERMKRSSDQVRAVEEQMTMLSQHSSEINRVVLLIEEVAKQTQLLSLNAEVQAGQTNRGFSQGVSMMAEEIRRLAEQTKGAVRQITALVSTVQGDIYSVTTLTGQTAQEFTELARLADEAGQALQVIWSRVAQQAKDIEAITKMAVWQESVAGKIAALVQKLAARAKTMGEIARTQHTAAQNLAEISHGLQGSIAAFRLPTQPHSSLLAGRADTASLPSPRNKLP